MQTLKELRVAKGYSIEFAAAYTEKSWKTIKNYESDLAHSVPFGTAIKLAKLYEVSIEELAAIIFPSETENP